MSLVNQTCWIVGGVGVIGKGIAKGLLKAGATVIVNSRSSNRLTQLEEELEYPDRLVTVHGSLLPGYASETVNNTLGSSSLNHVIAHGAVRYWDANGAGKHGQRDGYGYDETHSISNPTSTTTRESILTMKMEDFPLAASHLASLHLSAAQELFPRIQFSDGPSSYTFVTGDGGGHPGGKRSPFQEINAHHVWGLSAALRNEVQHQAEHQKSTNTDPSKIVNCRELRIKLDVNRPMNEREIQPRDRPLSEDIGALCAGLVSKANIDGNNENGTTADIGVLLEASDHQSLESLLEKYGKQSKRTGTEVENIA